MSAALESTVKNAKNTFRALIVAGLVLAYFYAQYLVFSERPIDRSLQVDETFLQRFDAWRQSNIGLSPEGELYFLSASPDFAALLPALRTVVPSQWGLIPGRMPLSIAPSTIDMAMAGNYLVDVPKCSKYQILDRPTLT